MTRNVCSSFLRDYGDLSNDGLYKGSDRAGYKVLPGAQDQVGVSRDPLSLRDLLKDDELSDMLFEDRITMQATMFEPVGGMDRIPAAFRKAIRSPIVLGAEVSRIRQTSEKDRDHLSRSQQWRNPTSSRLTM